MQLRILPMGPDANATIVTCWLLLVVATSTSYFSCYGFSIDNIGGDSHGGGGGGVTDQQQISVERIPGIWKLISSDLPFEHNDNYLKLKLTKIVRGDGHRAEEILINLQNDGTFKQCNEDYVEGKWISGRWKLVITNSSLQEEEEEIDKNGGKEAVLDGNGISARTTIALFLAFHRQYFGPQYDVLLKGKCYYDCDNVDENDDDASTSNKNDNIKIQSLEIRGKVLVGKFIRPINEENKIFDDDDPNSKGILENSKLLGSFTMKHCLSSASLLSDSSSASSSSTALANGLLRDDDDQGDANSNQFQ